MTDTNLIWFARFIIGLPPRKNSDDLYNFAMAFPELTRPDLKFRDHRSIRLFHIYNYLSLEEIEETIKLWRNTDYSKRMHTKAHEACPSNQCPLKTDSVSQQEATENNNQTQTPKPIEFIAGPMGDIHSTDYNEYVNLIVNKIDSQLKQKNISLSSCESYYMDPYIFNSLKHTSSKSFTEKFLKTLNIKLNNSITFFSAVHVGKNYHTSDQEITNLQSSTGLVLKKVDDKLFHDRFLILKSGNEHIGVLIGASVSGFTANRHYIIASLEPSDAQTLWNILATT